MQQIAVADLLGNALLFVPFGLVTAIHFPTTGWRASLAVAALSSLAAEVGQALEATGRVSDVTDITMNTLGGAIGFGVARWAAGRRPPWRRQSRTIRIE
jgi:glycopeptide antibiotics resistance protein